MKLYSYQTGACLREATPDEIEQSLDAAETDGGVGVFRAASGLLCFCA